MKKYSCLLLCTVAIGLTFLSGCASAGGSSAAGTNTIIKTDSGQVLETTDWEPTTYEIVNNFEGVTMGVKEGTVSLTGLTLNFSNSSDKQCIYGDYFLLEKKVKETWYQVPTIIDNYGFHSIGYDLAAGGNGERKVDWSWLYGKLEPGDYRIVKDILDFRGTGDYEKYYLAAEFSVDEGTKSADLAPMVMIKGKLYLDTGKESDIKGRCGVMDGEVTSTVEPFEKPAQDNQSNFGSGYGYQFVDERSVDILMNGKWLRFELS
ncbi:immunoglobulin-like domain-containing protein [Desulfitobacterium chlororespirans]|uniref:Bacterial Ig-like domain-containing protein n=1 Tax=Desulfitobacterium chlororespirans DSM 11544 TaxID=1121395 RepID=A0A1M7UPL6_9FIRM|nr:immunoglobulin-like domain-containing protein [Desulfitobacterium chlororespirans]SHN84894.1 hypothetical protein SAMN02745215_04303 [Desulfitobacterium chlororespirans DSM 11544]